MGANISESFDIRVQSVYERAPTVSGAMVKDQTILTPSSIFVIAMASIYIITAIMHPQEFHLVFYGFLYIICIPSAYLLLIIYSMTNLDNVSWGTRETKAPTSASTQSSPQTRSQKGSRSQVGLCRWEGVGVGGSEGRPS